MKDRFNYDKRPQRINYNGRLYRSKLEAHWAAFFDALKLKFYYEIESTGNYIPDFYIPEMAGGGFFEVKPLNGISHETIEKTYELQAATGKPVTILNGPPDFRFYPSFRAHRICKTCNYISLEIEPCLICGSEMQSSYYWISTGLCAKDKEMKTKESLMVGGRLKIEELLSVYPIDQNLFSKEYSSAIVSAKATIDFL
jgi:hypothetical protein